VQATATTDSESDKTGSSNPTATSNPVSEQGSEGVTLLGIDMPTADPCALLTREETEAIMGPLDWMPKPHALNDHTYKVSCNFDQPLIGDTPDKSLTVDLYARDTWIEDYNDLQLGDAALISPREVGLGDVPSVGFDDSYVWTKPEICDGTLPCVVAKTGDQWLTLTMLLPDRSAVHLELNPRNVDYAKQLASKILGRLPMK
jgi:hypothetical protein